jgi:hypothetical protein
MRLLLIAATAITTTACWGPGPRDEELPVNAPFRRAAMWGNELFIQLAPGVPLSAVVDHSLFEPLKPETTVDQARAILGEPLAVRPDGEGAFYLYRDGDVRVELAHLRSSSSSGTFEDWCVFSNPKNNLLTAIVSDPVQRLIVRAAPVEEIIIHEDRSPAAFAFSADLVDSRLSNLRWYQIER